MEDATKAPAAAWASVCLSSESREAKQRRRRRRDSAVFPMQIRQTGCAGVKHRGTSVGVDGVAGECGCWHVGDFVGDKEWDAAGVA